jgi:hypothetical protein
MTHSQNTTRVRIAIITVAALMLVLSAAPIARADTTGLPTVLGGQVARELLWSNGAQYTFTAPTEPLWVANDNANPPFYVLAPQTSTPQGTNPFNHDHVISDIPSQNHGDYNVRVHGIFVFCSALGISSGACVPTMTSFPGQGMVPFAKTVNGQMLTSSDRIESAASSGLVVLIDTGAVIVITINPSQ